MKLGSKSVDRREIHTGPQVFAFPHRIANTQVLSIKGYWAEILVLPCIYVYSTCIICPNDLQSASDLIKIWIPFLLKISYKFRSISLSPIITPRPIYKHTQGHYICKGLSNYKLLSSQPCSYGGEGGRYQASCFTNET